MSDNSMIGQVAIVTGAARGFGLAISERLMQRGVRVFGWDQEPSPIVGNKRFLGVERIDVTDRDAIQSAVESAQVTAGQINILVNNAGINGPQVPVEDLSLIHI